MQNRILSFLGIATKAGKTVSGEYSVEKAVKENRAALVLVAEDASDNTRKMFGNMCLFYHVPIYIYGTKEELGKAAGKEMRASIAVVDEGFGKALEKQIKSEV